MSRVRSKKPKKEDEKMYEDEDDDEDDEDDDEGMFPYSQRDGSASGGGSAAPSARAQVAHRQVFGTEARPEEFPLIPAGGGAVRVPARSAAGLAAIRRPDRYARPDPFRAVIYGLAGREWPVPGANSSEEMRAAMVRIADAIYTAVVTGYRIPDDGRARRRSYRIASIVTAVWLLMHGRLTHGRLTHGRFDLVEGARVVFDGVITNLPSSGDADRQLANVLRDTLRSSTGFTIEYATARWGFPSTSQERRGSDLLFHMAIWVLQVRQRGGATV